MSEHDWTALDIPGIKTLIERAARSASGESFADADDLFQLGTLHVTEVGTNPYELAIAGEYGLLYNALTQFMERSIRTERVRQHKQEPVPEQGTQEEEDYYEVVMDLDHGTEGYTQEVLIAVLPALWDESYLLRLDQNKQAADADMPRGTGGRVKSNGHWALIADVRNAWEKAPLNEEEKQCILLAVGLDYSLREIAEAVGLPKSTVDRRIRTGLHAMCEFLNGVEVK